MAHVSNEEYMQRWEDAAPEAAHFVTEEDVKRMHEARENAPRKSYDAELTPEEDPALVEAMAEYASRVSDAEASSQTKEELARLKESSDNAAAEYQWLSPEEYKNEGDRIGRIMHSVVFLNKLREAGIKCWYRAHPQAGKVTLIIQRAGLPPEVGCWCQIGFAPELSIMRFDEHGVPLAEKYRGWRTPLLQLILKGIISEQKAVEIFGKPATTKAFHRYNSTLQRFRNAGSRLED
jgi:hypothetical protein